MSSGQKGAKHMLVCLSTCYNIHLLLFQCMRAPTTDTLGDKIFQLLNTSFSVGYRGLVLNATCLRAMFYKCHQFFYIGTHRYLNICKINAQVQSQNELIIVVDFV